MGKNKNKTAGGKAKGWAIAIGCLLAVSAIAGGSFAIARSVQAEGIGQKAKDEKALLVGVERAHDGLPVSLTLSVWDYAIADKGGLLYSATYVSDSAAFAQRAGQSQDLAFHDFTAEVAPFVGDGGIFYWETGAEGWQGHSIRASTSCGTVRSSDCMIVDSGIWYVSTADANGQPPAYVTHSNIYVSDSLGL